MLIFREVTVKMLENCKIDILGEEWSIEFRGESEDPCLKESDGYTDSSVRLIVVDGMSHIEADSKKNLYAYKQQVLRHEILHAFLCESGLSTCSHKSDGWAADEEIVDWFAIQVPKIVAAFKAAGCL